MMALWSVSLSMSSYHGVCQEGAEVEGRGRGIQCQS